MSEWLLVYVLVAFGIGFISGLIYALRLYKHMEAASDREWAKRRGMRELKPQYREMSVRTNDQSDPSASESVTPCSMRIVEELGHTW
jgi:hypothetical protein